MEAANGVVFFVKNPDLSPVKTRLAERIGEDAVLFYKLCLVAVGEQAVRLRSRGMAVYFATKEKTNPYLPEAFPRFKQVEGNLGTKMITAINALLEKHATVTILGSDAPTLPDEYVIAATEVTTPFALGPTLDGGYYALTARKKIPVHALEDVRFSSEYALEDTIAALQRCGAVSMLPKSFDVDTFEDLHTLHTQLCTMPEQKKMLAFVEKLLIQGAGQ